MNEKLIKQMQNRFDEISKSEGDIEFWFARDLQVELEYSQWRNFKTVIEKGIIACQNSGVDVDSHFQLVDRESQIGSGASRKIEDFMLTRYACYLIAQNGDSRKEVIAFAQSYFALQTRKQELISERIQLLSRIEAREKLTESEKRLSKNIYERGVDNFGFARIRSEGDRALFGGKSTKNMKEKYGITHNRPLADFLPTLTIAAKNLATEMTNHTVERDDIRGEESITHEHVRNNQSVRNMLGESGIKPEALPPAEDLKKLSRRLKSEEKKLHKTTKTLPPKGDMNEDGELL